MPESAQTHTVPLLTGAYQSRSSIAEAQRCVNLYMEKNPPDAPFPTTHYPTPGLTLWSSILSNVAQVRGMYLATNGVLFAVVGNGVYTLTQQGTAAQIGTIASAVGPVSMVDNGSVLAIVDNSTGGGWVVNLSNNAFASINNSAFYGSTRVAYIDTFFVFNNPGTNQFYCSNSNLGLAQLNTGPIATGSLTAAGGGYANGTFFNVPLTGGSGTGAYATITVAGNVVTAVTISNGGNNYKPNDVLSAALTGSGGAITGGNLTSAGSGLQGGTYNAQPLTGGVGTGATANIVVTTQFGGFNGMVTSLTIVNPGLGYLAGDVLSANIPKDPSGFGQFALPNWTVSTVSSGVPGGFTYTVSTTTQSAFNSLNIAAKTGFPDDVLAIATMHREIYLIGRDTTEVWFDSGAPDFPFQIMAGVFIQHGIAAPQSLAQHDLALFFLSRNPQGQLVVVMLAGYKVERISNHAIENIIQGYQTTSDAIGFVHQFNGHVFYVLTFPTQDVTWVYDLASGQWHQRATIDTNGFYHRSIANCFASAYGLNLVGGTDGNIYFYDANSTLEAGVQIPRVRSWQHLKDRGKRVFFHDLIADFDSGQITDQTANPLVSLRWSDDGGRTWGSPVTQPLGKTGMYKNQGKWNRLGMARDRVFELSWSEPTLTALNGAWIRMQGVDS